MSAVGLILLAVLFLWLAFVGLFGVIELGVDDTIGVGLVPGSNGDAIAPLDPGAVGSDTTLLQACNGDPHKRFCAKAESGKPDKDLGI